MREGIHPDYHQITVVMTDGTSYQTRSTYGKAGDTLRLDIDSKSHPAWTGGQQRLNDSGAQLAGMDCLLGEQPGHDLGQSRGDAQRLAAHAGADRRRQGGAIVRLAVG